MRLFGLVRGFHWAWVVLAVGFYTVFIAFAIRFGYGVLLPKMIESLQITKTQAGFIVSSYFIAYTIFSPIAGMLTDKIGGRKVITGFCILLGLGTILMSRITNLWLACIFYTIVGVGASACWTAIAAVTQKWFSIKRRGIATGIFSTGWACGYAMVGLLFPILVYSYGWRFCWFIMGLAAFSLVFVNGFLLRSKPEDLGLEPWGEEESKPKENIPESQISYKKILKTTKFWLLGISYMTLASAITITWTFVVTYLNLELKIDYTIASTLFSLIAFSAIAGSFAFSTLSDYFGRRNVLLVCNIMIALAILNLTTKNLNILTVALSMVVFGSAYGGISIYAICAADYFSQTSAGTVLGLWTIYYGIGAIISPVAAGILADTFNTFTWSFNLASLMAIFSTLLLLPLKNKIR